MSVIPFTNLAARLRAFAVAVCAAGALLSKPAMPAPGTEVAPAPASASQAYETLKQRAEALATRLQQARDRRDALQSALASLPEASEKDAKVAVRRNQELARALAQVDAKLRALAKAQEADESPAHLRQALDQAQRRRDELLRKLARTKADPATDADELDGGRPPGDRRPIHVRLVNNRVLAMNNTYFSAREAWARASGKSEPVRVMVISRKRDGEAVAAALAPGGVLSELLGKADPARSYVNILVCADSIAAFRLLAPEIARRGFRYAWDTAKDEDIVQRIDGRQQLETDAGSAVSVTFGGRD